MVDIFNIMIFAYNLSKAQDATVFVEKFPGRYVIQSGTFTSQRYTLNSLKRIHISTELFSMDIQMSDADLLDVMRNLYSGHHNVKTYTTIDGNGNVLTDIYYDAADKFRTSFTFQGRLDK
jgi:hypothetical protein